MLKALIALLSKAPRDDSAKKPAPNAMAKAAVKTAMAKPATAGKDYRAVSVAAGAKCCSAAKNILGKRYLLREGPRLPLADCTMPSNCLCKFKKAADRRDGDGDRRQIGVTETGRWFAGPENRKRGGRRSAKD
ncbi:MAG TPA: hypothetical protein VIY54_11165 [Steroidobacteraceae bacterium]